MYLRITITIQKYGLETQFRKLIGDEATPACHHPPRLQFLPDLEVRKVAFAQCVELFASWSRSLGGRTNIESFKETLVLPTWLRNSDWLVWVRLGKGPG